MSKTKTLILKLANMTRNFSREENDLLFNYSLNGIEIRAQTEDGSTPMPWDVSFEIINVPRGTMLSLTGGVDAGGFGYCEVQIPLTQVDNYYKFEINITEGKERPIYHVLRNVGIRFTDEASGESPESEASLTHAYWSLNENDWVRESDGSCLMDLEDAAHFLKHERERLTPEDDTEGSVGLQHDDTTGSWVIVRTTIVL